VLEDLAMAVYLPLIAVLLIGQGFGQAVVSVAVALLTVGLVLYLALRHGEQLSARIAQQPDEVLLFAILGLVLLVAGIAQRLQVSAAIGAFLVGIAVSGPIAGRAFRLIHPLRDLFAALFFLFFSLQIDPATLVPALPAALALGLVTALTKMLTGRLAAARAGLDRRAGLRAGAALIARGEFSIVIAGLAVGAGVEPQLGAFSAAYVLFLAVLGPIAARFVDGARSANSRSGV
jgi:CPA2 family monovalent cation:H+ antiporter-2